MFEVYVRNPEFDRQPARGGAGQGMWVEEVPPLNPNIPEYITERVHGISATVDNGSLIIIEGSGSVSAIYPTYQWQKAIKVQTTNPNGGIEGVSA